MILGASWRMSTAFRVDRADIRPMRRDPVTGFLVGEAIVATTGVFEYLRDGKIVRELRHPDEVFHPDSLASLRVAPVTFRHPPTPSGLFKSPKDAEGRVVGAAGSPRTDSRYIKTDIAIFAPDVIETIEQHKVRQISPGYRCDAVEEKGVYNGQPYDLRQTQIRYNHIAILEEGRQGVDVGIRLDAADASSVQSMDGPPAPPQERKTMLVKIGDDNIDLPDTHAPAVTASVSKLQARTDALSAELAAAKKEAASSRTDAAALPDLIAKRVARVVELRDIVGDAVPVDTLARADALDISKTIVKALAPNVDLTGKTPEYIAAYSDFLLDAKKTKNVEEKSKAADRADESPLKNLADALSNARTDSAGGGEESEAAKAYKASIERNAKRGTGKYGAA